MLASAATTSFGTTKGLFDQPLDQLINELPLGVVQLDHQGLVCHANAAAMMLVDGSAGVILRAAFCEMSMQVEHGVPMVESVLSLGQLGEVRVLVSKAACLTGYVGVLERDTTARARGEIQVMRSLLSAATEACEPAVAAQRALATLGGAIVGSSLALFEHDHRSGRLECLAHFNVAPQERTVLVPLEIDSMSSLVGRVFTSGRALHVTDLSRSVFAFERSLPDADRNSAIGLPVNSRGDTIGVLYIWGPRAALSAGEMRLVLGVADAVGSLVRHARVETRVKQQQASLTSLMAHLPDAVIERGADGRVSQAGGRCESIFGLPAAALQGQLLTNFLRGEAEQAFDALVASYAHGATSQMVVLEVTPPDGQRRRCEVSAWVTAEPSGELVRAIFRDVTERERLEREVQQVRLVAIQRDRLALIGQLAAGVAHEINNPLAYVKVNLGQLGQLQRELNQRVAQSRERIDPLLEAEIASLTTELEEISRDSLKGVDSIVSIVRSLKGMSRAPVNEVGSIDPSDGVTQAVTFFVGAKHCSERVECRLPKLPEVRADLGGISQVVLNLLENALDAMGSTGRIAVTAEVHPGWVHLLVTDNGPGIPAAAQEHMFEPFYTTKPVGKGTGLGLHISLQIVESFGGKLRFVTGLAGTTFVIELAIVAEP